MKRKKALLLCALLLAVLPGCSSRNTVVSYEEPAEDTTTITFFGNKYEPENVTVIEEIISGFMKENPNIKVSYESVKGSEYFDALEKRMSLHKGDDVFMVNHDSALKLEAAGQLYDLSSLETIPGYTEQMLAQMEEQGKIYWMPTTVSAFGLYCNMDLLKEHGQTVPKNLEEWEAVCGYFVEQNITPIIANNDISLKTLAIGVGFSDEYQAGTQSEAFSKLNLGEEKLSKYLAPGFSLAEEFIERGYIDAAKALETEKTSDDLQEFVRGETPFMLTGAWAAGRVKGMEPEFKFQVVPYPVLEDGELLVMNPDTRLSINAESEHLDAAVKFVEYFTRRENIQRFADQQCSFSPLKDGSPSSVKEIQGIVPCYQTGNTVIGSDAKLELPIWNLTAEASKALLSGESLENAMDLVDHQAMERGGKS